jgi:Uma2 family endonuclease
MSTLTPPETRRPPTAPPPKPTGVPATQLFLMEDVSWRYYEQTVAEFMDRHLRVTYDQGRMEIMTTGDTHELTKKVISRLLETYATEKDIPITGFGSVTCRKKNAKKGLDPDECYYVQTPPPAPTGKPLNLSKVPPPDFAIEIDVTNSSVPRQPIYAAFGVREIWRFDGEMLSTCPPMPAWHFRCSRWSSFDVS